MDYKDIVQPTDIIFKGCKTGHEFENRTIEYLRAFGFDARSTRGNDKGIDIVAKIKLGMNEYTYSIQCKYFNKTVGNAPIQEIYAGTHYYDKTVSPVVITNNRVTVEARLYAKQLGVEIIADAEWQELEQVSAVRNILNPNKHTGLMGTLISIITGDKEYFKDNVASRSIEPITDKEKLKLELMTDFDKAEEYVKEAARLQQQSFQFTQRAITLQKEALLKNLDYK